MVFAQTFGLRTDAIVGVTNNGYDPLRLSLLDWQGSSTGGAVSASASQSFEGLNGDGNTDQLNYSGQSSASAQYGVMKTYGSGRLENSFFNSENIDYYSSDTGEVNTLGIPDRFISYGQSQYNDYFQYNSPSGNINAGVKVDFWYNIHGTLSGDASYFSILVENDGDYDYILLDSDGGTTNVNQTWTTKKFTIGADLALQHTATLISQFDNMSTEYWENGTLVEGTAAFQNTVTLGGMNLYDANDNLITGWNFTASSGADYGAVPEPATMTILGLAAIAAFKRKRK